jgi:hypothetical protein
MVRRKNRACGLHKMVTCMCCNGSERMELLGTVVSSPELRNAGTVMLWNRLERMAVLNHKLDRMFLCTVAWPSIVPCVTTIIMWITTTFHRPNQCIT